MIALFLFLMDILILIASTWRISSLLTNITERGPYGVLDVLHHWTIENKKNEVAKALSCLWCTSIWVGLGITVAYMIAPKFTKTVLLPFALSALAISLERVNG